MEQMNQPKKEDLTCIGFRPGVGMMYVDKKGKKFVERRRLSVEENTRRYSKAFRDPEGHKIHMSKKDRRRLKARYEEYLKTNKEKEDVDKEES